MDKTTNTEKCVNGIKEEQDEAIILRPALTKRKMNKTTNTKCVNGIKEEQDEAIILRPALKKKKRDKMAKDNTEECVNGNMEEPDEDAEVIDLEEWSDESAASSVDSTEEEMFLDGLDPLLDR